MSYREIVPMHSYQYEYSRPYRKDNCCELICYAICSLAALAVCGITFLSVISYLFK